MTQGVEFWAFGVPGGQLIRGGVGKTCGFLKLEKVFISATFHKAQEILAYFSICFYCHDSKLTWKIITVKRYFTLDLTTKKIHKILWLIAKDATNILPLYL